MNNMTTSLKKKSYSEIQILAVSCCCFLFIMNHLVSKGQQLQTGETFLGITSISLSAA